MKQQYSLFPKNYGECDWKKTTTYLYVRPILVQFGQRSWQRDNDETLRAKGWRQDEEKEGHELVHEQILDIKIICDRKGKKLWLSHEKYVEWVIKQFIVLRWLTISS